MLLLCGGSLGLLQLQIFELSFACSIATMGSLVAMDIQTPAAALYVAPQEHLVKFTNCNEALVHTPTSLAVCTVLLSTLPNL